MTEAHPGVGSTRLWTAVAFLAVAAALVLFVNDRGREPGPSYRYAVADSKSAPTDPTYRETRRISLNLEDPSALAMSADGKTYVAGGNALLVLDAAGKETARFPLKWKPGAIAVFGDGKILLGLRSRVDVLDAQGTVVASWGDLGPRACITSIAVAEEDVFVADAGNRVVLRYDKSGNLKNRIGEPDPARKNAGFVIPSPYFDLAHDSFGALWVVNPGKHGLENYRPSGEMVTSWYRTGMDAKSFCGCCNPIHIAFLSDGSVVTAEKGLNRVKLYGPDTELAGMVATPADLHAADANALAADNDPPVKDMAVDADDRIWILHGPEKALLAFEKK